MLSWLERQPGVVAAPAPRRGLLQVYTGDGKGKSTAAFGTVLRAWGRGFRICVIQFIKAETGQWGEIKAAKKLGIEWVATGDGFTSAFQRRHHFIDT